MDKTGLVELLSKLSTKQMRELGDFVRSPFFNKNESVEKLFDYLKNYHPEYKPEKIDKETVFTKLFAPAEYSDSFMRMLIFKLTELTEKYLAYSEMTKVQAVENTYLAQSFLDLGLDKNAQKTINNTEKELKHIKIHEARFFERKFELEKLKHIIYSRNYNATTIKDKPDETLLAESDYLTSFFLIMILQRYRYLLNKSYSVNSEYKLDFLPDIIKFLENDGKKYLENKTLSLLYRQIKLLTDPERDDLFFEIKKELLNEATPLEEFDRRDGLTILSNLCIEKAYSGKEEFFEMMFDIDRYLVEKNLYNRIKGGYFEKEMFMNVIAIALRQGKFDWTRDFIESYCKKLHPDIVENIRNYSYARLYLKLGEPEKAKQYISKVAYTDIHIKINARITKVIIEYELGNIEEVLNELENFRKYIQNDKLLSKGNRKISSNFIKFVNKLCKARYSFKLNLEELKKEIKSCDMVNNRQWLIDKTEELKQRRN